MSDATDYSTEAQVRRITAEFSRKRARMFIGFAVAELIAFAAAIIVVYVLGVVERDSGQWILVGIALVSSVVLSTMVIGHARAQQQAIRDVGGTPFPGSTGPTF